MIQLLARRRVALELPPDIPDGGNRHDGVAVDDLAALRRAVEASGLTLEAIENFDPLRQP